MRILTAILLLGASIGSAQALPRCEIGLHVDSAGPSRSPGTITDADEGKGSYRVQYDHSSTEEWMSSSLLAHSCAGAPSGPKGVGFFTGEWDDQSQRGGPDLAVYGNGTYQWLVDGTVIEGTWHRADSSQLYGGAIDPGIVLENGPDGRDWVLQSLGDVDSDNHEFIYAMAGRTFTFFR